MQLVQDLIDNESVLLQTLGEIFYYSMLLLLWSCCFLISYEGTSINLINSFDYLFYLSLQKKVHIGL